MFLATGRPLKRVDTDRPIVFEQELDRRTFETVSVHYVINENIFRIFVTIFFINFFLMLDITLTSLWLHFDFILTSPEWSQVKEKWSQSEVKWRKSEVKVKSSEVKVKEKWSQSEVSEGKVKEKWSQSEVKWSQNEIKVKFVLVHTTLYRVLKSLQHLHPR